MPIRKSKQLWERIFLEPFGDDFISHSIITILIIRVFCLVSHVNHPSDDDALYFPKNTSQIEGNEHSVQRIKILADVFYKQNFVPEIYRIRASQKRIDQRQISTDQNSLCASVVILRMWSDLIFRLFPAENIENPFVTFR